MKKLGYGQASQQGLQTRRRFIVASQQSFDGDRKH
jgi:hypothetical protein